MEQMELMGAAASKLGCAVRYHEPMSAHTTFKIGGPADLFVTVEHEEQLTALRREAYQLEVPVLMLGNGSNLLVSDDGIRGMVVVLDGDFKKVELLDETTICCGAGASLKSVCTFARDHSLTGAESLYGIPGSAGGAAMMNAGAYGGEMKDILKSCRHVTRQGELGVLSGPELDLSYRHSAYTGNGAAILSLTLCLKKGDKDAISARMDDLMGRRKEKQPLEMPSAGSVFKRPEGHFAGALIEQCGLKEKSVGGAMVSPKHAGFIVNTGNAACRDVLGLIHLIQDTVKRETGVILECEVKSVGGKE